MKVEITGQYASLSRGRITAKHCETGKWGVRGNGTVVLDSPGKWLVSQTDGFSRRETVYVTVDKSGIVAGLGRRMRVVSVETDDVDRLVDEADAVADELPGVYGNDPR